MMTTKEECAISDKIPQMSMSGLRDLFYTLYKEVGEYKINQWLRNFKTNYQS